MKRFFFALIVLLALAPVANAVGFLCTPYTAFSPSATGSEITTISDSTGRVDAFWCPDDPKSPKPNWRPQYFIVLSKYSTAQNAYDTFRRIAAAPDLLTALNTELKTGEIAATTPTDKYNFALLRYKACMQLITKPYTAPIKDQPASFCGVAPVLPGDVYITPKAGTSLTIYAVNAAKTGLASIVSGSKAPAATTCDCSTVKVTSGVSTYCPLVGAPVVTQVTQCVKQ